MATIAELLKPYLEQALPHNTEYRAIGYANLVVTLPKLDNMSHRKSVRLIFDSHVIETVQAAHAAGDPSIEERVGNYICDVLSAKFAQWGENNVQVHFHVDSHALDKPA